MSLGTAVRGLIWFLVAIGAWFVPRLGDVRWKRLEVTAARFARRGILLSVTAALVVLLGRAALLPLWEIPKPMIFDEFGYILQADTFASGRLTNPTHPFAPFFESIYILQRPTYTAKFPPGQGLMLSLGQMVFGNPWFGVWLSCGLLAAVVAWALRGWFSPGWAMFGTILILPLCISSYWMNSYWGGAVAAAGGALVMGAYPRLARAPRLSYMPWILGLGSVVLMYTRPFEGLLFLVPVFASLWTSRIRMQAWAAIAFVGIAGAAWLGYYNSMVTGSATNLPYVEYDRQYPSTPHLNILPLPPAQTFAFADFRLMDHWERDRWARGRQISFLSTRLQDLNKVLTTFLGSAVLFLPVALFWPSLWNIPGSAVFKWILGPAIVSAFVELLYYEHYAAPLLIVLLVVVVQAFRNLRTWKFQGRRSGLFLVRVMPLAMLGLAFGQAIRTYQTSREAQPGIARRARLEEALIQAGPAQLVFVRYTKERPLPEEWIYNQPDIDNAPVVWARDLGVEENRRLVDYFKGRAFWLLQPDENPDKADPYDPSQASPSAVPK